MTSNPPKDQPIAAFAEAMKSMSQWPGATGNPAMDAWFDAGNNALRFVFERWQHDIATQSALLGCTKLEDVQRVQTDFFKTAMEQYSAEAKRMMETFGSATSTGMAALTPGKARKKDDVPL